eukprot:403331062
MKQSQLEDQPRNKLSDSFVESGSSTAKMSSQKSKMRSQSPQTTKNNSSQYYTHINDLNKKNINADLDLSVGGYRTGNGFNTTVMRQRGQQQNSRTKRFSEYCEEVNEMIKKSVNQVAQIIERDQSANTGRRMSKHRQQRSRSRMDVCDFKSIEGKSSATDLSLINQAQKLLSLNQQRTINNNSDVKNPKKADPISLTDFSTEIETQPQHQSLSFINSLLSPKKDISLKNNQKQSPLQVVDLDEENVPSSLNKKNSQKTFGLWNINTKLISKQYPSDVVLTQSKEKLNSLQSLNQKKSHYSKNLDKIILIQRFIRGNVKRSKQQRKKLSDILLAVSTGLKVRNVLQRDELKKLKCEISELSRFGNKSQKQSQTSASIIIDKKNQFFNLFKKIFLVYEQEEKIQVKPRQDKPFKSRVLETEVQLHDQSISSMEDENIDINEVSDNEGQQLINYKAKDVNLALKLLGHNKLLNNNQMSSFNNTGKRNIQRKEVSSNQLISYSQIEKSRQVVNIQVDQQVGRIKSQSTYQPGQNQNQIKKDKRSTSPQDQEDQAPSLVNRCKDKYQNTKHKNFLKKRTGHEYDPLKAAKQDDEKRKRSGSEQTQPFDLSSKIKFVKQKIQEQQKNSQEELKVKSQNSSLNLTNLTSPPKKNKLIEKTSPQVTNGQKDQFTFSPKANKTKENNGQGQSSFLNLPSNPQSHQSATKSPLQQKITQVDLSNGKGNHLSPKQLVNSTVVSENYNSNISVATTSTKSQVNQSLSFATTKKTGSNNTAYQTLLSPKVNSEVTQNNSISNLAGSSQKNQTRTQKSNSVYQTNAQQQNLLNQQRKQSDVSSGGKSSTQGSTIINNLNDISSSASGIMNNQSKMQLNLDMTLKLLSPKTARNTQTSKIQTQNFTQSQQQQQVSTAVNNKVSQQSLSQQLPQTVQEKFDKLQQLFIQVQNKESQQINAKDQQTLLNQYNRVCEELSRDFKTSLQRSGNSKKL